MPNKSKGSVKPLVDEGWLGPGRRDGTIKVLDPSEDALHIDISRRGHAEWWYFDARLETGHTLVVFFHARNPNPGPTAGKTGMELVLLRPGGRKTQLFIPFNRSEFQASRDKPEVTIGKNTLKAEFPGNGGLPVYQVKASGGPLTFDLVYRANVDGWKPGDGLTRFGRLGYFAWVVPFARASVEGKIIDRDAGPAGGETETIEVRGLGYHDHNWLTFQFQRIIEYWMWGRIYSENYTVSFVFLQTNKAMGRHAVQVLMLAKGKDVILSTGDFEFRTSGFVLDDRNGHYYPENVSIVVPGVLEITLEVEQVLEAVDMLESLPRLLQLLARGLLRLKPGYFRLQSRFKLVHHEGGSAPVEESGSTLHEIVLFKPARN